MILSLHIAKVELKKLNQLKKANLAKPTSDEDRQKYEDEDDEDE